MPRLSDYQRGQADMRRQIERQWRGWSTSTISGIARVQQGRPGNVPSLIRKHNPVGRAALERRDG